MSVLNNFLYLKFEFTWKFLSIGLYGYGVIPVSLSYDEVIDYIDNLLLGNSPFVDDIISLLCEKDDRTRFDNLLRTFSEKEDSDVKLQIRKWRVCLFKKIIDKTRVDYYDLLEIAEFWSIMGWPKECLHLVPDDEALRGYFTTESVNLFLKKCYDWIDKEATSINNDERHLNQVTISSRQSGDGSRAIR